MILDASVVVAWFLPDEPLAEQALQLRDQALTGPERAIVPAICWIEVAHALVRAMRRDRLPAAALDPAASALRELMTLLQTHEVDPVDSMRLAIEHQVGAYDATYLCLARSNRHPLLTLDRRLADVGVEAAIDVVWLGNGA
ncbi:MAG: type II toxin-antitoxin system VapC family toxin [Chloroflexota bacterium]